MWNGVMPIFEESYSIIAPDIRGHGKSDKPLEGYHIEDMAEDLYFLLKKLEVSSCHIIGSSMGAEIGLCLAARHPELVLSLVCEGAFYNEFGQYGLFNGSAEEIQAEKDRQQKQLVARELKEYSSKEEFVRSTEEQFKAQGFWNNYFRVYVDSLADETEEGMYTSHYKNYVRIQYIQNYWDLRFEEYYKNIKCPILFLPSNEEFENVKIKESLKAFTELVSKYEVRQVDHTSHAYVWMQEPRKASSLVKNFLESL